MSDNPYVVEGQTEAWNHALLQVNQGNPQCPLYKVSGVIHVEHLNCLLLLSLSKYHSY